MSLAPRIDSLEQASLQTDVIATRMGQKIYVAGTAYANGTPGASFNVAVGTSRVILIPYQMQDGSWRLRLNGTTVLGGGQSGFTLTLSGVVFSSLMLAAGAYQAVSVADNGGGGIYGLVDNNSNTLRVFATTSASNWAFSGDVELASKPTWAY
jgi:hypothetical protein